MKKQLLLFLILTIFLAGCAGGIYSGTFISSGEHTFGPQNHLSGDVFIRAGTVQMVPGSQVPGSIYMLGGSLLVNGRIGGDLLLLGGELTLGPTAVVEGDLRLGGGEIDQAESAVVQGQTISGSGVPLPDSMLDQEQTRTNWFQLIATALLLAGLGAFLAKGRPQPLTHIAAAISENTLASGAMGLLLLIVLPSLLVMMAFTIFLIPLVIIIGLLFILLLGYGFIALGYQLGLWLSQRFEHHIPPEWAAFGGILLLFALFQIPVLGDGLLLIAAILVMGAVFLTRLGSQPFRPEKLPLQLEESPADYARPGKITK